MAATATANSSGTPPYVTISVTGLTSYIGGVLTVVRLNPDGSTDPVRQADPNMTITAAEHALLDYEVPYGAAVSYRTLAVKSPAANLEQTTSPVTISTTQPWLVHPGTPALSQAIEVVSLADRHRDVNQSIQAPLGRRSPVVLTDGALRTPSGSLVLTTETLAQRDALMTLCQDLVPLLLNIPVTRAWGVTSEWLALTAVNEDAFNALVPYRTVTLPYRTVERPVGTINLTRTWATVLTEGATWTDIINRYATWLGVYSGTAGV